MLPTVSVFALTTHGLETVGAHEMGALPGVTVTQIAYRRISATCSAPLALLLGLRTVDDVFLDLATWTGLGRTRAALARLHAYGLHLDLSQALVAYARVRPLGVPPTFSVSASFVGRRNYSIPELKSTLATGIVRAYGWVHNNNDAAADLGIRLFIEHETAYVGVQLGKLPLHERSYRLAHRPGALKPSVAAALVAVAGIRAGMRVLDPCCGTGTIVIEAAHQGAVALGGDIDPEGIAAARMNAAHAGVNVTLRAMDARHLPLAAGAVDRAVSNLPWGRQVQVDATLATFYRQSLAELARVLTPDGTITVLTSAPDLVSLADWRCLERIDISLFGQRPTILVCAP